MTKRSCQTLIAFKKLLVRFVLIWNKATDNIAINFYYLVLINMCFPIKLFQKIALNFSKYGQDTSKLIISYSKGYTPFEQGRIHCSKICISLGSIISNMMYIKYTHSQIDTDNAGPCIQCFINWSPYVCINYLQAITRS